MSPTTQTPKTLLELINSAQDKNLPHLIKTNLSKEDFSTLFLELPQQTQSQVFSKMRPYFTNYEILLSSLDTFQSYNPENQRKIIGVAYDALVREIKPSKEKKHKNLF